MVLLREIMGKSSTPSALGELRIWDIDAESITPSVLASAYYRAKQITSEDLSRAFVHKVADAITLADEVGQVRNDSLKDFNIKRIPMLSGEFREQLTLLSEPKRRCLYFALAMDMPIENAVDISWGVYLSMLEKGFVNDVAASVADSMPRHFKSPNVFWDYETGNAGYLRRVRQDVELNFGCTVEVLQERFNNMVICDPKENAEWLRELHQGRMV